MAIKTAALCALSIALAGCASGRSAMYASTKHPKGGIVRYAGAGSPSARQRSRDSAAKLMAAYCSGTQHVVAEGPYHVLDTGADVVPAGEYGFSVQDAEENYWLIVFDCGTGEAAAPPAAVPAPAAVPVPRETARAPVALDFAALEKLSAPDVYRQLVLTDAAQAAHYLENAWPAQKKELTAYIFKNKGLTSGNSWQFQLAPGLDADEKRFVAWYLQNYTDYKPVY